MGLWKLPDRCSSRLDLLRITKKVRTHCCSAATIAYIGEVFDLFITQMSRTRYQRTTPVAGVIPFLNGNTKMSVLSRSFFAGRAVVVTHVETPIVFRNKCAYIYIILK